MPSGGQLLFVIGMFWRCLNCLVSEFLDSEVFGDSYPRVRFKERFCIIFHYSTLLIIMEGQVLSGLEQFIFILNVLRSCHVSSIFLHDLFKF